jgi:quercetin 2,3-dioxygenase
MEKKVKHRAALQFTADFSGLKGVNIMERQFPIEPFLVFTEFLMDRPVFGPHPHAGISVMTYMLPESKGSFINRDSQGDFSTIEPGGLHITQAGSGIHHDEFPKITGQVTHGFQIWINHTERNRMVAPKAMHAKPDEIPVVKTDGYRVRVLHGAFEGTPAIHKMMTDVVLLHVYLHANQKIIMPANEMAFVYGLTGEGISDGESVHGQVLLNYDVSGDTVVIQSRTGLEFIFASGTPTHEPLVYGGPFVMTTNQQMQDIHLRYATGLMGELRPYQMP